MPKVRVPDGRIVNFPDTMSRDEIKSFINSKFPQTKIQPMTDEQRQQASEMAKQMRPEKTFSDKVADVIVTNPITRLAGFGLQGVANAGLNPAGYVARSMGIDTKPLEAQNYVERGAELASQLGFETAGLSGIGNIAKGAGLLGKGQGLVSRVAQSVLAPNNLRSAVRAGAGGGLAEGMINPETEVGKLAANVLGSVIPEGVAGGLAKTSRSIIGGLENVLADDEANQVLSKGIKASQKVARKIKQEAPTARKALNQRVENELDNSVGGRTNYDELVNQKKADWDAYASDKMDMELYDASPTREDIKSIKPESKFNPNKKLSKEEADALLRDRAALQKLGIYNDELSYLPNAEDERLGIQHLLDDGKRPYIRTLNNTIDNPDITFSDGKRNFTAKSYENSENNKNFIDWIITEDGKIVTKYPTDAGHISNQIKKSAQNMSLSGRVPTGSTGVTYTQLPTGTTDSIARNKVVVNPNLPKIGKYLERFGNNEFEKMSLQKALNEGAFKSDYPKGSLGATYEGKNVLNDMISASYKDNPITGLKDVPSSDTPKLMKVKEVLSDILAPSGIRPYDKAISDAKELRGLYNQGYKFKPSDVKFDRLELDTSTKKKAFLEGVADKITDDVRDGKSLGNAIRNNENTLQKLLPEGQFKKLMQQATEIDNQYSRLGKLENQAESQLTRNAERGQSMWRENLEGIGSVIGRGLDLGERFLTGKSREGLALKYLDPNTREVYTRGGLIGGAKKGSASLLRQALIRANNNNEE